MRLSRWFGVFVALFVPMCCPLPASAGDVIVEPVLCLHGHSGFIDYVTATPQADLDEVCRLFEFGENPPSAPAPVGGPQPTPKDLCEGMGGKWNAVTHQCQEPPPPVPSPCPRGACPTCSAHGPWDVMLVGLPDSTNRWAALV